MSSIDMFPNISYEIEEEGIVYTIIEDFEGIKRWYRKSDMKTHRVNGPAIEYPNQSILIWVEESLFHRLDGPAVIYSEGTKKWFFKNKEVPCKSQEEFESFLKLKAF